jgi:hypothetical protein
MNSSILFSKTRKKENKKRDTRFILFLLHVTQQGGLEPSSDKPCNIGIDIISSQVSFQDKTMFFFFSLSAYFLFFD